VNKNLRLLVSFAASDRLSGPLKNIVGLGQSGSEKLAALKKEARGANRELKEQRDKIAQAVAAGGKLGDLVAKERELAAAVDRTNSRLKEQERLNRIKVQADAMKRTGADMRSSGTENIVTGVAMAAPMVLAARQAMTLESAMADVRKVVEFENPQQFAQMSEDITDMSTRIPMAAEGLAQIVAAAGRAGVARKELLTFAEDAAQMGIAFDTTAEDAGGMMAKWRTAFGLGQTDVRTLADQINALTNTYGGNVGAVAGVTTRIGALGKVAGLAAPEIAAMAQLMNSVGVEEEIAATGIKNTMLAMTKGEAATKAQQKAFAKLGLDAKNVANAMQKDAGGAIMDLLARIKKLPEAQQAATLTQLFGSESVAAIAPMLTNLEQLQKNFTLVGDKSAYAGSMQKEYLARIATTEGAWGLAKNALTAVNISLGNMLLPTITAASQKIVVIANSVREWAKENPGLAKGLLMAWAGASGLVIGLGALKVGFGLLLGPFSSVFRLLLTNGPMLMRVFTGIRTAAMIMGSGLLKAGAMMWANPIVLIIAGIVAAVAFAGYMIYKHWDKISAAFKAGVAWVKGAIGGLPGWLKNLGSMMMDGLLTMLNPLRLANRMIEIAKAGITAFKNYFGIKSPSRLMMGMGGFITDGLAVGIDRGKGTAIGAAKAMATGVAGASMVSAAAAASPASQEGNGQASMAAAAYLAKPASPAGIAQAGMASRRSAAPATTTMQFGPITITINALPGQSPQDIAEAVADTLRNLDGRKAAAHRSAFSDV